MFEIYIIIVTCSIVLSLVIYKLYFESRFTWLRYEDCGRDPNNILCGWILYKDKYKEGIQIEYFYDFKLTKDLVNAHISSKNQYHRKQKILNLLGLKMRD